MDKVIFIKRLKLIHTNKQRFLKKFGLFGILNTFEEKQQIRVPVTDEIVGAAPIGSVRKLTYLPPM